MDNGLIFPYPCAADRAESLMLSALPDPSGEGGARSEGVVGKPVERRRRLAGPGRWLSRGKGVGRAAGKSAVHEPET
jgi:hypothetical protein